MAGSITVLSIANGCGTFSTSTLLRNRTAGVERRAVTSRDTLLGKRGGCGPWLRAALRLTTLARSLCFTPPTKFQDGAVSGPAHVEAFELHIAPFCNPAFSHYRAFELVTSIAVIATVRP